MRARTGSKPARTAQAVRGYDPERKLVPKKGLEPPHPCEYMDLNHARLPIPPLRHLLPAPGLDEAAIPSLQKPGAMSNVGRGWLSGLPAPARQWPLIGRDDSDRGRR